jgi:hypothetical protein
MSNNHPIVGLAERHKNELETPVYGSCGDSLHAVVCIRG